MDRIDPDDVAEKYNRKEVIWDPDDAWHIHTKEQIDCFVYKFLATLRLDESHRILNAGSGGATYPNVEPFIIHVDVATEKIKNLSNAIVADLHNIPLPEQSIHSILCVGSVINYCDAMKLFQEFNRILQHNGYLVLEFENSKTLELIGKADFNRKAVIQETFYQGQKEKLWYYSEDYIRELAGLYCFETLVIKRIHQISPLVYRIFGNERFASRFGKWDAFISKIPFLKQYSSNTILLMQKRTPC